MKRYKDIIVFVLGVIFGICIVFTVGRDYFIKTTDSYQIVNKTEQEGRYYVEVWLEVTPEEYIGLDVGDILS